MLRKWMNTCVLTVLVLGLTAGVAVGQTCIYKDDLGNPKMCVAGAAIADALASVDTGGKFA